MLGAEKLIDRLASLPTSRRSEMNYVLAQSGKYRKAGAVNFFPPSYHDSERCGDGPFLSSGNRRVQKVRGALLNLSGNFLGSNRGDRAHVDHNRLRGKVLHQTAIPHQK